MSLEAKIEANTIAVKALTAAIEKLFPETATAVMSLKEAFAQKFVGFRHDGDDAVPFAEDPAPQPEAPKKTTKRAKKAEPAPAPQPEPVAEVAPVTAVPHPQPEPTLVPQDTEITNALPPTVPPTKEEFTRVMHKVVAEKGRDALVRLLDSFGYSRVFEAPEARWADMVVAAEEILIN